jgi:hypothetical protein
MPEDAIGRELELGIEHHLRVDEWFHAAAHFVDGERATAAGLRAAPVVARRMPLLAHVAWELCLDGALLSRVGLDDTLSSLRATLPALRAGPSALAALHHFDRAARTPDERARFDARLSRILDELARGPWLERYTTPHGIAEVLGHLRARLGLDPLQGDDAARVAEVLADLAPLARHTVERILLDSRV